MMPVHLNSFIDAALSEDIGSGDHSSDACIPEDGIGAADLLVKESCVIAGVELAEKIFLRVNPDLLFEPLIPDGTPVSPGDLAFTISGQSKAITKSERLVLNCMQRMSGIATYTRRMIDLVSDTGVKVLDTRKTTPGFRAIEKWAVRIGGGHNHRMGLYDMIMIKDNHIDYAGGIERAMLSVRQYLEENKLNLQVVVEARSLEEVGMILNFTPPDRILLDNFTPEETQKAVLMINGRCATESSGGINDENIRDYALCGVDYISVGAVIHQAKSIDLSLKAK